MEARLNDPEVVEAVLAAGDQDRPPARPALSEFTPELSMLTNMVDRLSELIAIMVKVNGGKSSVTPMPRPLTGIDRALLLREEQHHLDLVDEVRAAQERWAAARQASEANAVVNAE